MYRGREVTQTGNKIMLQRPQQEIVTHPLSMFSRPRQSQLQASTSPDKFKRDFAEMDVYQADALLSASPEESNVSPSVTPAKGAESPVSIEEAPKAPVPTSPRIAAGLPTNGNVAEKRQPVSKPTTDAAQYTRPKEAVPLQKPAATLEKQIKRQEPVIECAPPTAPASHTAEARPEVPASLPTSEPTVAASADRTASLLPQQETPVESAVQDTKAAEKKKKRFTFNMFDKKTTEDKDIAGKKQRRRTLSFTKSPDIATGPIPAAKPDEPSVSHDATEAPIPHPAVRPLGDEVEGEAGPSTAPRSKPTDLPPLSVPTEHTYGRCACCGRIRKPHGQGNELSPVLENENIRMNFEIESKRASLDQNRKHVAIMPMAIPDKDDTGSIRTVQASIEPRSASTDTTTPRTSTDTRHANASMVSVSTAQTTPTDATAGERASIIRKMKRHTISESGIVRFGSLHGKRGSQSAIEDFGQDEESEEEIIQSVPVVQPIAQPPVRNILAPSEQELLREKQQQKARNESPTTNGATQRTTHPLRETSPIDRLLVDMHSEYRNGVHNAQQQHVKRVPKQDIITVVPLRKHSGNTVESPQDMSPHSALSQNAPTNPPSVDTPSIAAPLQAQPLDAAAQPTTKAGKLQKSKPSSTAYPPTSYLRPTPTDDTSPARTRRLSLPGFLLPSTHTSTNKRTSLDHTSTTTPTQFSHPYTTTTAGTPPDDNPANRPPLPSQTNSARPSMSSDHRNERRRSSSKAPSIESKGGRRRSSSRETGWRSFFSSASASNPPNGVPPAAVAAVGGEYFKGNMMPKRASMDNHAGGVSQTRGVPFNAAVTNGNDTVAAVNDKTRTAALAAGAEGGGKTLHPSPSFVKFVGKLPATHAKDLPGADHAGSNGQYGNNTGVGRFGRRRGASLGNMVTAQPQPQQQPGTVEATGSNAVGMKAEDGVGVVGGTEYKNTAQGRMPTTVSLPALSLGGGLEESGTLRGLLAGKKGSGEEKLSGSGVVGGTMKPVLGTESASVVREREAFVGGKKLEMMLERDRLVGEVGRV